MQIDTVQGLLNMWGATAEITRQYTAYVQNEAGPQQFAVGLCSWGSISQRKTRRCVLACRNVVPVSRVGPIKYHLGKNGAEIAHIPQLGMGQFYPREVSALDENKKNLVYLPST